MQSRRIKSLHLIIILMMIVTIIALTFAGLLGAFYIKERTEVVKLREENEQLQAQLAIPVISFDDTTRVDGSNNFSNGSSANQDAVGVGDIEEALKQRMKELVMSEDGSPLKMLRSFFPENLIYYDEEQYVFSPVLDAVKKHDLISENFVENENGEMEYIENGVVTSHKGIDVSKYQEDIDWPAVKADGVEYAFIRLGLRGYESGKIVLDDYFEQNMRGANEAGVKAGVYFFSQAVTVEEAKEEADFVLENITDYEVPYPIVLDIEMIANANGRANTLTMEARTDIAIAFCETIKQAGYTPMIYGNVKCFTKMLDLTRLEEYEKWYAFYDNYMYMPYEVSCWQYTEKGKVNGIKKEVDLNISYKVW